MALYERKDIYDEEATEQLSKKYEQILDGIGENTQATL